ncbi:MAG: hypothetical protein RIC19_20130 [Phaeodactylibacter sp.]
MTGIRPNPASRKIVGITAFSNDPFGETKAVFGRVRYREFNNNSLSEED